MEDNELLGAMRSDVLSAEDAGKRATRMELGGAAFLKYAKMYIDRAVETGPMIFMGLPVWYGGVLYPEWACYALSDRMFEGGSDAELDGKN